MGRSVDATERDGHLILRPLGDHAFDTPAGVRILHLDLPRILAVTRIDVAPGWSELRFSGDQRRFGHGEECVVAPILATDADTLVAAVTRRLSLPRRPLPVAVRELLPACGHDHANAYITTSGTYQPGHFEGPNFDGVRIERVAVSDPRRHAELVPGQRFVITGFVSPGTPPGEKPHAGYNGVNLYPSSIEPQVLAPVPRSPQPPGPHHAKHAGVTFRSLVGRAERGQQHADVFSARPSNHAVVGLFRGVAADCGDACADVCRWSLADLLGERAYPREVEPPLPVRTHLVHWTSYLLDRAALPADLVGVVDALAARLDRVFARLAERANDLGHAEGVLASVSRTRARIVRRGSARVYRVRDGVTSLVVEEDTIERQMLAEGITDEAFLARMRGLSASSFAKAASAPAIDLTVAPGDRLVFVTYETFELFEDGFLERSMVEPSLETLARALEARAPAGGWGVVAVDIDRT
ncbi:MAG: hypothetical protein NT062_18420 [Proteobacteria bacterium]|nr:hypothetical protein [Pseudomonadota bacterium]